MIKFVHFFLHLSFISLNASAESTLSHKDWIRVLNNPKVKEAYKEKIRLSEPNRQIFVEQNIPLKISDMLPRQKEVKSIDIITPPSHGVISGSYPEALYIPDNNYYGRDEFTYRFNSDGIEKKLSIVVRRPTYENLEDASAIYNLDIGEDYVGFHWGKTKSASSYEIYVSDIEDDPPSPSTLHKVMPASQLSTRIDNLKLDKRYNIDVVPVNANGEQMEYCFNIFPKTMKLPDYSVLNLIHDSIEMNGGKVPRITENTLFLENYSGIEPPKVGTTSLLKVGALLASLIDVQLKTRRKHQIRQHLSALNFPTVGNRLYEDGESDGRDLQLQSVSLSFMCPIFNKAQSFSVPIEMQLHYSCN